MVTMECYNAQDHCLISKLARAPISLEANKRLYAARHMSVADMRFFDVLDIGGAASVIQPVTETQPYADRFSRMQMAGMGVTYGNDGYVPYHIYKQGSETILVFFHETIAKARFAVGARPSYDGRGRALHQCSGRSRGLIKRQCAAAHCSIRSRHQRIVEVRQRAPFLKTPPILGNVPPLE